MKKTARKTTKRPAGSEAGSTQRALGLTEVLRAELRQFVITSGMKALEVLLEEERK